MAQRKRDAGPDEAILAKMSPEQAEEVRRLWARKVEMDRMARLNPIGFYKPLPTQIKFHTSTKRKRLLTGGNRSGKTESGAAELLFWIRGKSPYRPVPEGELNLVVSSLSFDLQRHTIIEAITRLMPEKGLELLWTRDEKVLRGPNGTVSFKSDEQGWKSYQGRALDAFWLDEEHSYETYRQLCKRLKAGAKIESWYTMTAEPDVPDHWTYEELALKALEPDSNIDHFALSLDENRKSNGGYIADSEIDELIANTPVEERPAVIHGKYVRRGGLIYPMWNEDEHLEPERTVKSYLDATREGVYTAFCWLDWGVRNPTAIGLVLEGKDEDLHLVDEIYHPAENTTEIKREWNNRFAQFDPKFIAADPSIWHVNDDVDPSQTIAGKLMCNDRNLRLNGLPLIKGNNDTTNGFVAVRDLLSVHPKKGPMFTVQPRCVAFRKEIANYVGDEWINAANLKNKKETARKKDDHHMDGFRYFGLSPHRYVTPRWHRRQTINVRVNPVTGYVRAAV